MNPEYETIITKVLSRKGKRRASDWKKTVSTLREGASPAIQAAWPLQAFPRMSRIAFVTEKSSSCPSGSWMANLPRG